MPDETPTPVEQPLHLSLTLPSQAGNPFQPEDAPESPLKLLPTSPSPAGDRWMNIFHGDEIWQGRWPAENDALLSLVDDPGELKMASANALWIAEHLGETHDAITRAYPMALGLTSLRLLGHMDGTDRDVHEAIRLSLVPELTPEDVAKVKTVPLSLTQYYLPGLVDEENRVPELDESRAYFQLGQFPLNLPIAQHEDRTPGEIEMLGRARWDKSLEQKGTPAPQRNGNLATDIVKSFFGGMAESSFTMLGGAKFFGDKVAEFIPGYEGSFFDKSTNAEIAFLQWQRGIMQNFYHVDPEFAQSYAGELSSTLGATVPQMLSMTLPPVAATMIGGQSFLYAWEDAENTAKRLGQPFNRNRAFAYALTMGAVNAAMTMVKFDLTVKPWLNTGGRTMVNNAFTLLRTTLLGTMTNVGQGAANDALAWSFGIEPCNPFDLERRKHDALLGAGASLVLSLSGMTLAPAAEKPAQPPPEKPAVTFDKSIGKQEVPPRIVDSAGTIRNANPTKGRNNCVNCAIAVDMILSGKRVSALPGDETPVSFLESLFSKKFTEISGRNEIEAAMKKAGPGSRAIIFGYNPYKNPGHVWNVVNQKNIIRFLDGQSGGDGVNNFRYFSRYMLLITNNE